MYYKELEQQEDKIKRVNFVGDYASIQYGLDNSCSHPSWKSKVNITRCNLELLCFGVAEFDIGWELTDCWQVMLLSPNSNAVATFMILRIFCPSSLTISYYSGLLYILII